MTLLQAPPKGRSRFDELLAPVSAEAFIEEYWEKRHLFVHRSDPAFYGSIFSIEDADRWLTAAQPSDRSCLLIVPPADSGEPHRRVRPRDVAMEQLYDAFYRGCTLVFEGVEQAWAPVSMLARSVSEALGARVTVNLYMTPAGTQGVRVHPDVQDVFVVQLEGSKDWFLYTQNHDPALDTLTYLTQLKKPVPPMEDLPLAEHQTLHQGDLLYIPRGLPHKAVAPEDSPSLHLAVLVYPVYWVDFLKAAIEELSTREPSLCQSVPAGPTTPETRRAIEETFRQLVDRFSREADPTRTLAAIRDAQLRRMSAAPDGHFKQVTRLDHLTPDTWMERRTGLEVRVSTEGDSAAIFFGRSHLRGPASIGPTLEYIRDHRRFQVRDLAGRLTDQSKCVLVRRLILKGLLRMDLQGFENGADSNVEDE